MEEDKDDKGDNIFGEDYNYFDKEGIGAGKNQTGYENVPTDENNFIRSHDLQENNKKYPQTELNNSEQIFKVKNRINNERNSSTKELPKVLNRKKSRADEAIPKKKRKTKTNMDITLKSKTEVNTEDKKKEKKDVFEKYNQTAFFDIYERPGDSGDIYDTLNDEDPNAEVNKIMPTYNSVVNHSIPESFDMCISENQ